MLANYSLLAGLSNYNCFDVKGVMCLTLHTLGGKNLNPTTSAAVTSSNTSEDHDWKAIWLSYNELNEDSSK